MKKNLLLLLFLLSVFFSAAQKYTISGYVENAESGEKLTGASVYIKESTMLGTVSNAYGFYSLTLPSMKYNIICSYTGYKPQIIELNLIKDTVINFQLRSTIELEEIEVSGKKSQVDETQMSKIDIPLNMIKNMPVLLGETDVLKTIQLLPGVQSGTEGTSGLYVRGGGPDQNLILIDGVPVYNVNHLFGFFSVFNADAISDVTLIKGGFPAKYGGRLSSIIDIKMKEGNNKKFAGAISMGLISGKLTLEGPIVKDKTSFILSLRRTWLDLIISPIVRSISKRNGYDVEKGGYYFWDINAKVNHKFSDKDRLYFSIYTGKDKFYYKMKNSYENNEYKDKFSLFWGNISSALRWNHLFGRKLFSNTTVTYTNYKFSTGIEESTINTLNNTEDLYKWEYKSGIDDIAGKIDFDYLPSPSHSIKFGASYIYHTFRPGVNVLKAESDQDSNIDSTYGNSNLYSNEYAIYVQDEIKIGKRLRANIGVHYSGFYVDDTLFQSIQPRISARLLFGTRFSIKAAYSEMSQYLHLLTNTTIGMPTDLWLPVTKNILPQKSSQIALGFFYSTKSGIDFSIEGYYKTMNNLIEYKEGASFFSMGEDVESSSSREWENKIEKGGKGESYGVEFLVKKNFGKTTGWIAYTYSHAWRQFENISFNRRFPYTYDRRHDISIVLAHQFSKRFDVGLTWIYGTGNAYTLALEQYETISNESNDPTFYDNNNVEYIENRNNFRMPSYHRLDLGFNFRKQKKHGKRTWSISVYNVYNRKNPLFLMFGYKNNKKVLMQYSIFTIIPSISYKYEF